MTFGGIDVASARMDLAMTAPGVFTMSSMSTVTARVVVTPKFSTPRLQPAEFLSFMVLFRCGLDYCLHWNGFEMTSVICKLMGLGLITVVALMDP